MLKGEGLGRRTDVVLIVLFNFEPRLPENLSPSLLSLTGSVFLCASASATRRKRNAENRTVENMGAERKGDGEIIKYFV
jgi:hypothetical protein